jgi:hypothetical protein
MILDFSESVLNIKDVLLESRQKSQLYDCGFRSDGKSSFEFTRGNAEKRLLKAIIVVSRSR